MNRRPSPSHAAMKATKRLPRRASHSRRRTASLRNEALEPRCVLSLLSGEGPALEPPADPPPFEGTPFDGGQDFRDLGLGGFQFASIGIVETEPADASTFTGSLGQFTVVFDRPIDPLSLGVGDVTLERVDADGNVSFALDPFNHPTEQTLDESGTRLTVTLPSTLALEPGTYRIVISDTSFLMGVDFSFLPNVGTRETVATFQLASARGATLDEALDLGQLERRIRRVDGALDFASDPKAVQLYRFTVPEGHFWRFGAELSAQRIGSPLDAAIALFDAQGNVLATADLGLAAAPNDPYLFQGLKPGTYYLGVSGTENLPGAPGGYDPAAGTPESRNLERAGGPYRLRLVIDPADEPGRLLNFYLNRADARDPNPTGFSLKFSGPVLPSNPGNQQPGVTLVDQDGQPWPVRLDQAALANSRLDYLFGRRLPAGTYTLTLAPSGGLRDLAGYAPIAPGQPDGVLATFTVQAQAPRRDAYDFGALYPDMSGAAYEGAASLQPGESLSYRFVVLSGYQCRAQLTHEGGPVEVEFLNQTTGVRQSFALNQEGEFRTPIRFEAGEYFVRVRTTGASASEIGWKIDYDDALPERIDAGVAGQDSALGLRLVASELPDALSSLPANNGAAAKTSGGIEDAPLPGSSPSPVTQGQTSPQGSALGGPALSPMTVPAAAPNVASSPATAPPAQTANGPGALSLNIAPLPAGGDLVGRASEDGSAGLLAQNATTPGAGVALDVASILLPAASSSERDNLAQSEATDAPGETAPESDAPSVAKAPGATTDGSIDAATLAAMVGDAIPGALGPPPEGASWLQSAIAGIGGLFGQPEQTVETASADTRLASMDPLTRLIPSRTQDEAKGAWIDPMAVVIAAAVVIEGRRHLNRWLGKRHGLLRLAQNRRLAV